MVANLSSCLSCTGLGRYWLSKNSEDQEIGECYTGIPLESTLKTKFKKFPTECINSTFWKDLFAVKKYVHVDPPNSELVPNSTFS